MPLSLKTMEVQIKRDQWNKRFRTVQVYWGKGRRICYYVSGIWIPPPIPLWLPVNWAVRFPPVSANVNKHWKTRAKGNDVIANVISANQHFASTFSMQIFKFQRRSCKLSRPAAGAPWEACSQARIPLAESRKEKKNSRILEAGWPYVGQNHLAQWNKPSIMKSSISPVPILSSLQRSSKLTSDVDSPSDMNVKTRILCTLFSWDKPGKEIKDMDVPLSYFSSRHQTI